MRQATFLTIGEVLSASAAVSGEAAKRLKRVAELFGVNADEVSDKVSNLARFDQAKAS
jgi:hypothetical protein